MKKIKTLLVYCGIFTMLFASCSKDEPVQMDPSNEDSYATLTFNSLLNDLSNKAMQKAQFSDIPDCMDETPTSVEITLWVAGEVAPRVVTVDVLGDAIDGYFTAYSDLLKIQIANDGNDATEDSVDFTLLGFKVYAGADLLWLAPVRTDGAPINEFAGYVERSLPFDETVIRGSKPYFDVEVLCFDRRMVNEYGYVFFDIVPKTLYPLCLFANYCNADGRHWVADYSIDLYYGLDTSGIQLYSNTQDDAMASTSIVQGQFQADPLCLVVPGPPANLPTGDDYLTLVVYPMDWNADGSYGDIDNSGVVIHLSWPEVEELLNDDGTSNEYLHILLGECEEALSGDGTFNPGSNDCLTAGGDCDRDGIKNRCDNADPGNINYATFDCDGDDILNGNENEGCVNNPDPTCGVDPVDPCASLPAICSIPQTDLDLEENCYFVYFDFDNQGDFLTVGGPLTDIVLENTIGETYGKVSTSLDGGDVIVSIDGNIIDDLIIAYEVEVRQNNDPESNCKESSCDAAVIATDVVNREQAAIELRFSGLTYSYPYYIRVKAISCEVPATGI